MAAVIRSAPDVSLQPEQDDRDAFVLIKVRLDDVLPSGLDTAQRCRIGYGEAQDNDRWLQQQVVVWRRCIVKFQTQLPTLESDIERKGLIKISQYWQ